MKKLFFLISVLALGCDDNSVNPDPARSNTDSLEGVWVDTRIETDTLIFDSGISDKHFLFRRGKEMRNGYLLPKPGASIYEFKIKPEIISLYNTLSSCYCFNDYFFSHEGTTITIGNFYDVNSSGDIRTFRKL